MDVANNKSNSKVVIIIAIIAIVLIGVGVYIGYFQNDKRIIGKAIDNIKTDITKYYLPEYDNLDKFDTFTMSSVIKFNVNSDLLREDPTTANLINNLNKTKNKVIVKQDLNNKKAYINFNSTIDNSELFSMKYLIENNTEYYYIKSFLDNYINNGNSNYFEALNKNTTSEENIGYIYSFALSSFKNHLDKTYFTKTGEKIESDGKIKNVQKITLELNNERLVKIAKSVLKDLKSDDKANKILTGMDSDFKNTKIKNNEKILNKNEKVIFSVYTDNITYAIKRYELEFGSDKKHSKICYTKGKQDTLKLYDNKGEKQSFQINYDNNIVNINMYDKNQNKNGKINIKKDKKEYKIIVKYNIDNTDIVINLNQKIMDIRKSKSYKADTKLSIKAVSNKEAIANIAMIVNSSVKKGTVIDENTDKAIFANDIDNSKNEILKQQLTNVITRLMG